MSNTKSPELAEELRCAIDDLREIWARLPSSIYDATPSRMREALLNIHAILVTRAFDGFASPALAKARGEAATHAR